RTIPGPPGAPDVTVRIYAPKTRTGTLPAVLWIHGGGFTAGTYTQNDALCQRFVDDAGCLAVSVDYWLAPEHPFPAPPEDCYAAHSRPRSHRTRRRRGSPTCPACRRPT